MGACSHFLLSVELYHIIFVCPFFAVCPFSSFLEPLDPPLDPPLEITSAKSLIIHLFHFSVAADHTAHCSKYFAV